MWPQHIPDDEAEVLLKVSPFAPEEYLSCKKAKFSTLNNNKEHVHTQELTELLPFNEKYTLGPSVPQTMSSR